MNTDIPMVDRRVSADDSEESIHDLQALTRAELQLRIQNYNEQQQRFDVSPTSRQQLGCFTVICLIMNRTIGTGIFTQPRNVLSLTGSSGIAILLWCAGGLIMFAIVLSWLELALTVPLHYIFYNGSWERFPTPRSGGDKNYLEYIYKKPDLLITCLFGINFIIFGHLAGNAIQFGVFMHKVIRPERGPDDTRSDRLAVVGWAVAVLSLCAFINVATRRFAIGLNNAFAVVKVLMIFVITILGIAYGTAHDDGCRNISWKKQGAGGKLGDIVTAMYFAMYPYTGYEQPFYVLAEVRYPGRTFAKSVIAAMLLVMVMFPLTNVGYLCVVPYEGKLPENIALEFFRTIARHESNAVDSAVVEAVVERTVSAILALFIVGNIMAQTFTAARVKQEIAKEAILPWSLKFTAGSDSLLSRFTTRSRDRKPAYSDMDNHLEQVPNGATLLHWIVEVLLVLIVGISVKPSTAYRILTFLMTFAVFILFGLLTVLGLAYLKIDSWARGENGRKWTSKVAWRPWLDPLPTFVACAALLFLTFVMFVPPSEDPEDGMLVEHWCPRIIGWEVFLSGGLWWLGMRFIQWKGRWKLVRRRVPYIEIDHHGGPVMKAEFVEHERVPVRGNMRMRHGSVATT